MKYVTWNCTAASNKTPAQYPANNITNTTSQNPMFNRRVPISPFTDMQTRLQLLIMTVPAADSKNGVLLISPLRFQ